MFREEMNILKLSDLEVGTIVTINATDYEKSVRLESEVLEISDTDRQFVTDSVKSFGKEVFCILNLITEGNIPISFLSVRVKCILTALINDKPYSWNDVKILKLKLPEMGNCHIVLCDDDVDTFNRRTEYRQWLGYDALCKFGDSRVPKDVILRDISPSGVGFVCDNELPVEKGLKVSIQFQEEYKMKGTNEYTSKLYSVDATIVRFAASNNNKLLVGCRLDEQNDELAKLVYSKQGKLMQTTKRALYKRDRDAELARALQKEVEKDEKRNGKEK